MMLRQKRPTEIKVIGIVTLVVGFLLFLGGFGLVTSSVSFSPVGVDVSAYDPETLEAISFVIGLFWLILAGYCAITVLCLFLKLRCSWILIIALSTIFYIMAFLSFQGGDYFDGTLNVAISTIIASLAYTHPVKEYLKNID